MSLPCFFLGEKNLTFEFIKFKCLTLVVICKTYVAVDKIDTYWKSVIIKILQFQRRNIMNFAQS